MPRACLLLLLLFSTVCAEDQDRLVRTSEARSAEEERKGFKVPEGFSVQLFADETLLGGKPINMAFDARGRLWVSSTREYPYAVPKARWSDPQGTRAKDSRDTIRILEDTDGDGRADKVTVFADELNIPTGVLPYKNGCIAFSIPNLWFLEDTDGDGKCDKRTILFGPLGWEKDTHGMVSSLRMGLDGWVYATHGFSNTSHFEVRPENFRPAAPDAKPDTLDITSGSVFRFKPDGSRVEPWTTGQVNPFGLCWDSWGNLYSADCHSNPITQLIRGAVYPQFGATTSPLGPAPVMCTHAHGSTGLCGIIYIDGGVWGPEWDDHMFVGNCVTSRVNHDHITFTGSTPKANEAPDFLVSDDPWFRPVDLQLGPDSALYIADFYNRIIGHYEVPLDHAGRDRDRGRIWRVVREGYTGKLSNGDLRSMKTDELISMMGSKNLARRGLAVSEIAARGEPAVLRSLLGKAPSKSLTRRQFRHVFWALFQLSGEQDILQLMSGFAPDIGADAGENVEDAKTCAAMWNVLSELKQWGSLDTETFASSFGEGLEGLAGEHVRKAAVLACASRPSLDDYRLTQIVRPLDRSWALSIGQQDGLLRFAVHMALRNVMMLPGGFEALAKVGSSAEGAAELTHIALSVPTEASAQVLLDFLQRGGGREERTKALISHISRHLPANRDAELIALAQKHLGEDLDTQLDLLAAIREGRSLALQSREGSQATGSPKSHDDNPQQNGASDPLATWASHLTQQLLTALQSEPADAWHTTTPPTDTNPNPWLPQTRKCTDGQERTFLDSHVAPGSEKLTGTFRSAPFALPAKLTLWIAGHRGFPTAAPHEKNFVRLVEADTGKELARAYPPGDDVAQPITWTFAAPAPGSKPAAVCLELTDGDTATAYAWLAVGGFDPEVAAIPTDPQKRDRRVRTLAQLATNDSATTEAAAKLKTLEDKHSFTPDTRAALAAFLAATTADSSAPLLAPLVRDAELAPAVFAVLQAPKAGPDELAKAFSTLPFRAQAKLATALAGSSAGAARLLKLAAPIVLAEPLVSTKLIALNDVIITKRLKEITASLPPQNEALTQLMVARLKSFDPAKADVARGEQVFTTVCAICHRIGVRGNLVGPQLDGIGARGAERLLEDILDPNRAVDPAFRLHMVKRKDGTIYAGLLRREEGDALVFADATAQETRIARSDIATDEESPFSLMPPGLGEVLTEQQLHDLLAYLLARK